MSALDYMGLYNTGNTCYMRVHKGTANTCQERLAPFLPDIPEPRELQQHMPQPRCSALPCWLQPAALAGLGDWPQSAAWPLLLAPDCEAGRGRMLMLESGTCLQLSVPGPEGLQ